MNRGWLWRLAGESLFLQALFAGRRRQGPGVCAALTWMRDAGGNPLPPARAARHAGGFNTNPAMAGPLLGAIARLEGDRAEGDAAAEARIDRFKQACEAPFAAVGDLLLWRGLRGGGGVAGAALALAAGPWGPAVFLAVYNAGHLGLRVGGVFWGFARGERAAGLLGSARLARVRVAAVWLARLAPVAAAAGVAGASERGPAALALVLAGAGYAFARGAASGGLVLLGAIMCGLFAARLWG